jgi:hypothetical protein
VSGLASGKGVFLPDNVDEAEGYLKEIFVDRRFGDAGAEVVIEDRLYGEEASILAFCDGYTALPLPAVQDHKRVFDNDQVSEWRALQGRKKDDVMEREIQPEIQHASRLCNERVSEYVAPLRIVYASFSMLFGVSFLPRACVIS